MSESDYHSIDESLKDSNGQIEKIQTEREKILNQIRLLGLEVSEKRIQRENLESRCKERYHCPVAALRAAQPAAGQVAAAQEPEPSPEEIQAQLERLREKVAAIGDVHLGAIEEYRLLKERFDFLSQQRDDLVTAISDLHQVIKKINKITQERFLSTFNDINAKLKEVFPRLFEGGTAWLELADPTNLLETGVEYMVQPAGKKLTRMSLLSGGEKALSAIAFIFAIFLLKPTSFCLMDEIDAPLDDANVFRFNHLLKVIGEKSQIVMITHNKRSMEFADTLFGITMEQKGISKVVSVNLQRN
jgi:chromosome segregation protein